MRNTGTRSKVKDWLRVGAKLSLLFTDPKVRSAIGDNLNDRVDDLSENVADKYESAVSRLDDAVSALQGRSQWPSRMTCLLLGVGMGAGLGILCAPAAGRETRASVRDKAIDAKNKVFESAVSAAGKVRQSVTSMPSTRTGG